MRRHVYFTADLRVNKPQPQLVVSGVSGLHQPITEQFTSWNIRLPLKGGPFDL